MRIVGLVTTGNVIRDEGGLHNVPAGNTATTFGLDIYVPPEFLDDVRKEIKSLLGEVRSIKLGRLGTRVRANSEGSPEVERSIRGEREIFRPNR